MAARGERHCYLVGRPHDCDPATHCRGLGRGDRGRVGRGAGGGWRPGQRPRRVPRRAVPGQRRIGTGCVGAGCGAAGQRRPGPDGARHEPGETGRGDRTRPPAHPLGTAGGGRSDQSGRTVVPRPGPRSRTGRGQRRRHRRGRRSVPPARRPAAGHRARSRANPRVRAPGARGATRPGPGRADRRTPYSCGSPPHPARCGRLVLRPADAHGGAAFRPTVRFPRRVHARPGGGSVR